MAVTTMLARHAAARTATAVAAAAAARVQVPRRWATSADAGATTVRPLQLSSPAFTRLLASKAPFVDKTSGVADLLMGGVAATHRAVIARPNTFGKSLTLGTARAILAAGDLPRSFWWQGYEEEAYASRLEGTAVYERFKRGELGDLMKHPHFVVSLSLGGATTGVDLKAAIVSKIAATAHRAFGPALKAEVLRQPTAEAALLTLVAAIPRRVPVAVLVDEYDAAMMQDVAAQQWDAAEKAMEALQSLMVASKDAVGESRISHFIVTGVSRFPKVMRGSGVSNFVDLTNDPCLSAAIGFTDAEIRASFPDHLARLAANETGGSVDAAMAELARWHGGYCFDGVSTCFSPFGVLSSLDAGEVRRTPLDPSSTWLGMPPPAVLERLAANECEKSEPLDTADLHGRRANALPRLLQTGLLTLAPPPTDAVSSPTGAPAPGSRRRHRSYVVPNEVARKALLRLLEISIRDTSGVGQELQDPAG